MSIQVNTPPLFSMTFFSSDSKLFFCYVAVIIHPTSLADFKGPIESQHKVLGRMGIYSYLTQSPSSVFL